MPKLREDLTGQVFTDLTVQERAAEQPDRRARWLCLCQCGATKVVMISDLKSGKVKSCGCRKPRLLSELRWVHGATKAAPDSGIRRAFNAWVSLRGRCNNPNNSRFDRYGARGIRYDPRWEQFSAFLEDMGVPPPGYSIEREDNNADYSKSNCHWMPRRMQAMNRHTTIRIRYLGQEWCFKRLCEYLNLKYLKVYKRYVLRGWTLARSLEIQPGEENDLEHLE